MLNLRLLGFAYLVLTLSIVCVTHINFGSHASDEVLYHAGDLNIINSTYTVEGVYYKQDGNVMIDNSTFVIRNATFELLQDGEHKYRFEAKNGNLILEYASLTVATKQLMPYLKLNFTIKNTNFTLEHSTISFPGRINMINSRVKILNSRITRIKSLPEGVEVDKNDDAPIISGLYSNISIKNSVIEDYAQIYFESSVVFIADSEFKNFHEDQKFTQELITSREALKAPDDENMAKIYTRETFGVGGFQTQEYFGLVKILNVALKARVGGDFNYNASDHLQYSIGKEYRNTTITFGSGFTTQTFNLSPNDITLEDMKKLKVRIRNNDPENDNNSKIAIDYLTVVVTYDTDVLLDNTELYAINSRFDLDFRLGDNLPGNGYRPLNSTNYLFNYDPRHSRLKALNKSFLWLCNITVDLTETKGIPSVGHPPFVDDASSKIYLSRWLKIRTIDKAGVLLENASLEIRYKINNTSVSPPPKIILDYLSKNFTNWNLTSAQHEVLFSLCSDLVTPRAWPNAEFVGNYAIIANYKNLTVFTNATLEQFPNLTVNSNVEELVIQFSNLLVPPAGIEVKSVSVAPTSCHPKDKITISGKVEYTNGLPVADAEITASIYGKTFSTSTLKDGSYSFEITAPARAQTYTIQLTIYDGKYEHTISKTEYLHVTIPPSPPSMLSMLLPIVIVIVVVVACFSTFLLRNRLKLWLYITKARMKKEKFIECGECGYLIPVSAELCPKCKASFEEEMAKCSECNAIVPITAEKCPACGASFEEKH